MPFPSPPLPLLGLPCPSAPYLPSLGCGKWKLTAPGSSSAPPAPSPTSAPPSAPVESGPPSLPDTGQGQQEPKGPPAAPRRSPRVTDNRRLQSAEPCFSSLGVVVGRVITDYYHLQNSQCTDMEAGVSMRGNRALVTQLSFRCRLPRDSQCHLTVLVTSSGASSSVLACVSELSRVWGLQCRKNPARGRGTGRAEAC